MKTSILVYALFVIALMGQGTAVKAADPDVTVCVLPYLGAQRSAIPDLFQVDLQTYLFMVHCFGDDDHPCDYLTSMPTDLHVVSQGTSGTVFLVSEEVIGSIDTSSCSCSVVALPARIAQQMTAYHTLDDQSNDSRVAALRAHNERLQFIRLEPIEAQSLILMPVGK